MFCIRQTAESSNRRVAWTLARPPISLKHRPSFRNTKQREPAGSRSADQQGIGIDLRGVRTVNSRSAPAYLPIQAVGGAVQAAPIVGAPGFNGYLLRQPHLPDLSGERDLRHHRLNHNRAHQSEKRKVVPFCGTLSHGLDRLLPAMLQGANPTDIIPRPTVPGPSTALGATASARSSELR